ncbi:MAG: hypothetical protein M0Q22_13750, partial [Sulfuritalea sp.]|nr:hypothetical protein [Sulfuritalea sp.]
MKSLSKLAKGWVFILSLFAFTAANAATAATTLPAKSKADAQIGQMCVECHTKESPGIVTDWKKSAHAGKKVDC